MESITRGVGRSKAGIREGREPLARMQFSKRMRSSASGALPTGCKPQRLPVFKTGLGLDDLHVALGGDLLQTAGERGDDLFLACPHGGDVDGRLGEGDAPFGQVRGLRHGLGHVQQGLRGDAAAEQARAAQPRLQIDQRDLHAEIGRQKCRGVTTRSAAKNHELCVHGKE